MIRMYWWQGGRGTGNFGDKLGPALVHALTGQRIEHTSIENSDLIAIGSSLEPWHWPHGSWLDYGGMIWGAGRLNGKGKISFPRAQVLAARGELTLATLSEPARSSAVVGDPGLLCGHLHHPLGMPRYKLGIWPHWSETRNPVLRKLVQSSPEIVMIDPCGGIRDTLDLAASCECIASSALHGLVVADALAIPNCWVRTPSSDTDSALAYFKFLDYFSAFQSPPPRPLAIGAVDDLDTLLPRMSSDRHEDAARLQDDLLSAFPYRCRLAVI
jgi:pyruvyltransferase